MFSDLLNPEVQAFIFQHETGDPTKLILKAPDVHGVPMVRIVEQIEGRRKAKEKLPTYYQTEGIIFPPSINLEQSSSEATGSFKSTILGERLTRRLTCADLTGGLGVDSFFLSRIFGRVDYVETNSELLETARHNHLRLGARNFSYYNNSAAAYLSATTDAIDCVYIDPSRRDIHSRKISSLESSEPNILELLPSVLRRSQYVLLKTSPLLDITETLMRLKWTRQVDVVSVGNECRELLFFIDGLFTGEPLIQAINLTEKADPPFRFYLSEERLRHVAFSDPQEFLYEPNASILKAGAFKSISEIFDIAKLHPNTHLYTSKKVIENFPGRIFKILALTKPEFRVLKPYFPEGYANIFTRNYPLTPQELKSKTRLKDGGERFLIGFSGQNKKFLAAATRIA